MQDQIIDKIRNRVRKLSDTHLHLSQLQPSQLCALIKLQRAWRRHAFRKRLKKLMKRRTSRRYVLVELIDTEREYIKDMKVVLGQVMEPLKEKIDEEMHRMLFINLEDIVPIHVELLRGLEETLQGYNRHTAKVSLPLLAFAPNIKAPYYRFCLEYKKSIQILRLLRISNTAFNTHMAQLEKQGVTKFELNSYMIKPIQRLCKYSLLISELIKSTEKQHSDLQDLEKAHRLFLEMVKETNDQIEEFVNQERLEALDKLHGGLAAEGRRYLGETRGGLVDKDEVLEVELYVFSDLLLVVEEKGPPLRFPLDQTSRVKSAPDAKYFKNVLTVSNSSKSLTLSMKTPAKKHDLLALLKKSLEPLQGEHSRRVDVDVEGTQQRESYLKKHTVYIVRIRDAKHELKIYPRFSELIGAEEQVRKLLPEVKLPHLEKDGWITTRKTKTIEKRKFEVQEFLIALLNEPRVRNLQELFLALNLECLLSDSPRLSKKPSAEQSIICLEVLVASAQPLSCWISSKAHVFDLKLQISQMLNLTYSAEFELFECRDKMQKLIYEEELVSKFRADRKGLIQTLFKDKTTLIYTRYLYLPDPQQLQLYHLDPNRLLFQLAVIRSELHTYSLSPQLKLTVLALFAKHCGVDVLNTCSLRAFVEGFPGVEVADLLEFRAYCLEIEEVVREGVPEVIVKVLGQAELYRCRQYPVTVYQKNALKKQVAGVEQEMILGVKRGKALLMNRKREVVMTIDYSKVKEMSVYATSIVFVLDGRKSEVRFDTTQSFEISKLIEKYSGDTIARKLSV